MNIILRPIEQSDNQKIAEVIRKIFREFKIDKPGTVYTGSIYWIAEENGIILGGCGIFPTKGLPEGCAELVKFYVSSDSRGKGVGNALMQKSIEWAKWFGYKQLYLESFPELNKAVSMYIRSGFVYLPHALGNSGHFACNVWMLKELK
jgi:putative acetyltransferase